MSRGRPRVRIAIRDGARLANAIDELVQRDFEGNGVRAAVHIGIERSLLNRLRHGAARSLSTRDLKRLRAALPADQFFEIERSLVDQPTAEMLSAFDSWVRLEQERLLHRDYLPDTEVGRAMRSVPGWESQRLMEYQHVVTVIRQKCRSATEAFDNWLSRRGHFRLRADLAYARIIAPLLDSREAGSIERGWEELTDAELRRFVKAGIERERILLDRPPDLQRAQDNARRDPADFFALYGELWDPRVFTGARQSNLVRKWVAKRRSPQ